MFPNIPGLPSNNPELVSMCTHLSKQCLERGGLEWGICGGDVGKVRGLIWGRYGEIIFKNIVTCPLTWAVMTAGVSKASEFRSAVDSAGAA